MGVPSAQAFVRRCKRTWRVTRANLVKAAARMKLADRRRIPAPTYHVGQRVWLLTKDIPIRGDSRKLASCFLGPFMILRVISPTAVRLRLPATMRRVHPIFHVSRLKPVVTHPLCPAPEPPPPPCSSDGGETYTTNRLSSSRQWSTVSGGVGGLWPRRKILDPSPVHH